MRFWRIEICHITDIYEKQKDYSVLKNEEKYMIEKVYDDNTLSFKERIVYSNLPERNHERGSVSGIWKR